MQTLKQQIKQAEQEICAREYGIQQWKLKLEKLIAGQNDCHHVFSPPVVGYEHEGGTCKLCGINQVYSGCQRIGAKYKLFSEI